MRRITLNYRINFQIRSPEVRLVGSDGKQIGVVKLQKAFDTAREAGLDLVETAPNAKPPVVKIVNLGKFKYEEEKKLKKQKKGVKGGDVKEVRFSPFIADHDYQTRLQRIDEFLKEKNKVKLVVVFKGRQMGSKQFGYDVLAKVKSHFKDLISVDMEPKFLGRYLIMTISPLNTPKKKAQNENSHSLAPKQT